MNHIKQIIHRLNQGINSPVAVIIVILGLAIYFGFQSASAAKANQDILEAIKQTTNATKSIVAKQDETLRAIQQVAQDNKLISEQKTNIIICMLQVPVEQRTTDTVANCRKEVETRSSTNAGAATLPPDSQNPAPAPKPTPSPTPAPAPTSSLIPKFINNILRRLGL